jgi:hypothetical protein
MFVNSFIRISGTVYGVTGYPAGHSGIRPDIRLLYLDLFLNTLEALTKFLTPRRGLYPNFKAHFCLLWSRSEKML